MQLSNLNIFIIFIAESIISQFIETQKYKVYELVDSVFPNDIIKKAKNQREKIFRHIAIDNQSVGYLFDINSKKLDVNIGICQYIEDKR